MQNAKIKRTYNKLGPVQKLAIVNSRLRHGDISRIAKETGFSSSTVSKVIEGNSSNERILNVAYDVTRRRKKNFHVIKDMETKSNSVEA